MMPAEPREAQGRSRQISRARHRLRAGAEAAARSRVFCGGSDFSVYEIDLDQAKPEPKELGRHDSYVTGLALAGTTLVSGGYDGRLIWWNVESRSQAARGRRPFASGSAAWRPRPTATSSPAWPTTWSAGSGTLRAAA